MFPQFFERMPLADVPFPNVEGRMMRTDAALLVFFHFKEDTIVPMHSHGAQWGIVLEGKMEFTIGNVTRTYRQGDSYTIAAGEMHGGNIPAGTKVIDVFEEPERYLPQVGGSNPV